MKEIEQERRDWMIVAAILLFGLFCVIFGGGWALRLSPSWKLDADMGSKLDPNSDYLTNRPIGFVEAIDPSILTQPVWMGFYLTPGASIPTRVPTDTSTPTSIPTHLPATNTALPIDTSTSTLVYFPPTATSNPTLAKTSTSIPVSTKTKTPTPTATSITAYTGTPTSAPTFIATATTTAASSSTNTPTATSTGTGTPTNTATATNTPTSTATATATFTATPTRVTFPFPYFNIGPSPDGSSTKLNAGSDVILQFSSPLIIGSHPSYDLVYYPDNNTTPSVKIGAVILWVGDGTIWYPIFNWGDGSPDLDTNIYINGSVSAPPNSTDCTSEPDDCVMDASLLYSSSGYYGVAIDLDLAGIPAGTSISYIRIFSLGNPPDTQNNGVDVDAIQVLP